MKKMEISYQNRLLLLAVSLMIISGFQKAFTQERRWLRIGDVHSFFSERGAEVELEAGGADPANWFSWPAAYGLRHQCIRGKALWVGCRNFNDVVAQRTYSYKVVGVGPRIAAVTDQLFEDELKLIAKYNHPVVVVDGEGATVQTDYDMWDEENNGIPSDRMIVIRINTSLGATITKKVMAFTHQDHDNYFIYDYVIKNTGIIDRDGTVDPQPLEDLIFFLNYRYTLSGESVTAFGVGWGDWNSIWGRNTVNEVINTGPDAHTMQYSWYGPHSLRSVSDDWGCPNETDDGILAAARYVGIVTLHADRSSDDQTNDLSQPSTTMYLGSDENVTQAPYSQFDEQYMADRYAVMNAGHADPTHAQAVGDGFADIWGTDPGGYSQCQGFGPYDLDVGDSIHIVLAEGAAGLAREKNREVGANWLAYVNGTGTPTLVKPDGSTTTDYDAYKREWVQTCEDSILKTFQNAIAMYEYLYEDGEVIPQAPPPPENFTVASGGDRIRLTWAGNAASTPNFSGYVIYRAENNVLNPQTRYIQIFESDASYAENMFDDLTARRGFDYYYYIQTKVSPPGGKTLYSSMFWTLTSRPARLRRPAGAELEQVRVVPNPYNISSRALQFGDDALYDRLAFYGLPPFCKINIYTERGDLIKSIEHDDGSGDEVWDSLTSSGQIVVSGIYLAYFEVTEDAPGFKKGDHIIRKFVIIR
jgi:hypothetical protein